MKKTIYKKIYNKLLIDLIDKNDFDYYFDNILDFIRDYIFYYLFYSIYLVISFILNLFIITYDLILWFIFLFISKQHRTYFKIKCDKLKDNKGENNYLTVINKNNQRIYYTFNKFEIHSSISKDGKLFEFGITIKIDLLNEGIYIKFNDFTEDNDRLSNLYKYVDKPLLKDYLKLISKELKILNCELYYELMERCGY